MFGVRFGPGLALLPLEPRKSMVGRAGNTKLCGITRPGVCQGRSEWDSRVWVEPWAVRAAEAEGAPVHHGEI